MSYNNENNGAAIIGNMYASMLQSRNYPKTQSFPVLHSDNAIISEYINCIKNENYSKLEELLSVNGTPNIYDKNKLSPLKIAILCNDLIALNINMLLYINLLQICILWNK